MELSPKQQAVNEIKKAKNVLILGHAAPGGDQLGSLLALREAFAKLQINSVCLVSDAIPQQFRFLPQIKELKSDYRHTDGKILRIDTKRIPISGMKWHKDEGFLNIHLETEKNLKFEFIEIINGHPKPDLIVVVDTAHVADIDSIYDKNEKIFLETPVLNIDHHAGNEYFGSINLVDLTATSTAEILVSLFEALGIKIDTPDMATSLLTGILHDTDSFRSQNTTPKSLTVAAQLLAAGARQQEIVKSLFNKNDLVDLWEELVSHREKDKSHKLLWTHTEDSTISAEDLFACATELISQDSDCTTALIFQNATDKPSVKVFAKGDPALLKKLKALFEAEGSDHELLFDVKADNHQDAINIVLKKIADSLKIKGDKKELWDIIEEPEKSEEPIRQHQAPTIDMPNSAKEKQDAIEEALKSISQAEKDENRKEMESLKDVLERKRSPRITQKDENDIFGDE